MRVARQGQTTCKVEEGLRSARETHAVNHAPGWVTGRSLQVPLKIPRPHPPAVEISSRVTDRRSGGSPLLMHSDPTPRCPRVRCQAREAYSSQQQPVQIPRALRERASGQSGARGERTRTSRLGPVSSARRLEPQTSASGSRVSQHRRRGPQGARRLRLRRQVVGRRLLPSTTTDTKPGGRRSWPRR